MRQVNVCAGEIVGCEMELKSPLQQAAQKTAFDSWMTKEKCKDIEVAILNRFEVFFIKLTFFHSVTN